MKHQGKLAVLVLLVGTGAAVTAGDAKHVTELNAAAAAFGWHARLSPPDPCKGDAACKDTLHLSVNTEKRTDLDQVFQLNHTEGENIAPCVKIAHSFHGDAMFEHIAILGTDDHVSITVPEGYRLLPTSGGGYTLAPNDTHGAP